MTKTSDAHKEAALTRLYERLDDMRTASHEVYELLSNHFEQRDVDRIYSVRGTLQVLIERVINKLHGQS